MPEQACSPDVGEGGRSPEFMCSDDDAPGTPSRLGEARPHQKQPHQVERRTDYSAQRNADELGHYPKDGADGAPELRPIQLPVQNGPLRQPQGGPQDEVVAELGDSICTGLD